jgi:hypothetical protein
MPNLQRQIRRDTRANINAYTLAQGELGFGTDDGLLTTGDGATPGGFLVPGPYAFGSFTPTLFGSTAAGAPTYTLQVGSYERIGRLVTVRFRVAISAIGGMTGNVRVGGLPYVSANVANDVGGGSLNTMLGITFDAGFSWASLQVAPNQAYAAVIELGSNKTSQEIPVADWAAAAEIGGNLSYHL